MAGRSVQIRDFRAAIVAGDIPGAFTSDARTVFQFPSVVSGASRGGGRRSWSVAVSLAGPDGAPLAFTDAVLGGGALPPGAVGVVTATSHYVTAAGAVGADRGGVVPTIVRAGKNLGKANATTAATQALRDALGLYSAKLRKATAPAGPAPGEDDGAAGEDDGAPGEADGAAGEGAPSAADAAKNGGTAAFPLPMLVQKYGATKHGSLTDADFAAGVVVQRKLNGVRLVAFRPAADEGLRLGVPPGGVCVYSRTRALYPGVAHIKAGLAAHFQPPAVPDLLITAADGAPLPAEALAAARQAYQLDAVHLDGELYVHGRGLAWISGQARRDADSELEYHVFDCFFPGAIAAGHDMPSAQRQAYLALVFAAGPQPGGLAAATHVRRVEAFPGPDLPAVLALRDRFLAEGYEGAIVRKGDKGYRYGDNNYHSTNLLKLKPIHDAEFRVVGYGQGARGKDVGAVLWIAEVDEAHRVPGADWTFSVVPKDLSYPERYRIYALLGAEVDNTAAAVAAGGPARLSRFARDFLGLPLTVEFPERSAKTGKPTQAKALAFRTYEGGPGLDPVRRLLAEEPPPGV